MLNKIITFVGGVHQGQVAKVVGVESNCLIVDAYGMIFKTSIGDEWISIDVNDLDKRSYND
jgi:hypothetical protein